MSRLLDEVLDLDPEGRQNWLARLPPEDRDLESALREALFPQPLTQPTADPLGKLLRLGAVPGTLEFKGGLQTGQPVGPYVLMRPLGTGGMAEVWLAQRADGAFKRDLALKFPMFHPLRRDLASRFARERDILAALEHPNIARLYDAGVGPGGVPFLAMEYVAGEPINHWCDARRAGIRQRLKLFLQMLRALDYAHGRQVIHRDIKPSNILVTDGGQVRLLDFGVAKLLSEQQDDEQITQLYGRALTPEYASPELVQGDEIGPASDIYSCGVVLYELLNGSRPYRLETIESPGQLEQIILLAGISPPSAGVKPEAADVRSTTRHSLVRSLKGDLDAIVLKALAKDPADRYPSAAEFMQDVCRYLDGRVVEARNDPLTSGLFKLVRRNQRRWAFSATAIALAGVAGGYALTRTAHNSQAPSLVEAAALMPPPKSIAVLPFVDMSQLHDQEYFSDGLSEELINRLTRSPDLKVIARTSSFQFKNKSEDVRLIAEKLGVAHLLEGSVRKDGSALRITAQLIRASDGSHLWSQTYDRNLVDVFKVQDDIAATVASKLQASLSEADGPAVASRDDDIQAYNLVLEGNYFKARRTRQDVERAADLYRQAIKLRSDYALAWARLASAYFDLEFLHDVPSPEDNRRITEALDRAIRLDPKQFWAYFTRAGFEIEVGWDWAAAQADQERMRDIDPRNAYLAYASADLALVFGHVDQAVQLYRKTIERSPLDSEVLNSLAYALCAAGRLQECLQIYQELQQLQPQMDGISSAIARAHLYLGHTQEALDAARAEPREEARLAALAIVYWAMGRRQDSDQSLSALTRRFGAGNAYRIAQVHAFRGQTDAALDWLARAYEQHSSSLPALRVDPLLRSLHGTPRFEALVSKLKLAGRPSPQMLGSRGALAARRLMDADRSRSEG